MIYYYITQRKEYANNMKQEKPEAKFCKHCKAVISYDAKICPYCRKKQELPIIPIAIVFAVILIFIAVISACVNDVPKKVGDRTDENTAGTASGNVTDAETEAKTSFGIGEIAEMNDIRVTLISVTESEGKGYFKPDDGKVYLLCEFEIENRSDKDIAVSSIISFEAYVDDYVTSMDFTATTSSDKPQLDGKIAAGKKMRGVIGYEVDADWSEIEIHFTADFWLAKGFVFIAQNKG